MRIERIVARAFGPFQGKTLELGPGMTVVAGPNESGKSSWHAALRLAITGVRRGKGPGTAAERQLVERHRPWDLPERWEVEARLALDDGRTIDISQDLGGKVACRAIDVELGRDVSDEIMDGTPDASRWLGLDRESFAATVSVNQSQILAVADAADQLQEHMQRAAATRGTDATAAEAIARLEQFRRDAVGADTVAAKGPLRTAKSRLDAASAALIEAQRLHADYLERGARLDEAERLSEEAQLRHAGAEAAHARLVGVEAAARAARAAELTARHPAPPVSLAARDEQADRVAAALEAWAQRPSAMTLVGRTATEIQAQIEALPAPPTGDTRPHPSVLEAQQAAALAAESIRVIGERPEEPAEATPGWEPVRLRELARRLRTPQLPQAAVLEADLARLRSQRAPHTRRSVVTAAAAGVALVAAAALFATGAWAVGVALVVLGLASAGAAAVIALRPGSIRARTRRAEAALGPYRQASADAAREHADAMRVASESNLPTDPAELDQLADRVVAATQQAANAADWDRRLAALQTRQRAATESLLRTLRDRGESIADGADAHAASDAYLASCEERAGQQQASERVTTLQLELKARRGEEAAAAAAAVRRESIIETLRRLAAELGLAGATDPDQVASALETWRAQRGVALQANQLALAEWQQLQSLLAGATLTELEAEANRRRQRASELAAALPADSVALPNVDDPDKHLAALRDEAQRLRREYDVAAGNLVARRDALPDVAEAEEAVANAHGELERVRGLAVDVDATLRLLRAAEERIHRDLAPILGQAVARWLPIVSRGAYDEVSVDPAHLNVSVKEHSSGQWRDARLLSEGTREQIYLLLRVAMAQHLVTTDERAPLLLDEVTAQSDTDRKRELLDVLHELSGERQVVLFTHDDEVVAWAERALRQPQDRLVRLEPQVTPLPVQAATPTSGELAPLTID
jgi:DNA repair protein SbcC/Rad50